MTRDPWYDRDPKCRTEYTVTATDDPWHSDRAEAKHHALSICATCPVRRECLDDALSEKFQYGIRGGMTADDRKALLQKTRGTKPLQPCGTQSAYTRHVRRREPIDDACRAAHTAHRKALRDAQKAAS